jgi:hypothetical protein
MARKREPEVAEPDKRRRIEDARWAVSAPNSAEGDKRLFVRDTSRHDEIASRPGRRSFGGFNTVVEKNYARLTGLSEAEALGEIIDEATMVARYETLVGLPRGPNQVSSAELFGPFFIIFFAGSSCSERSACQGPAGYCEAASMISH